MHAIRAAAAAALSFALASPALAASSADPGAGRAFVSMPVDLAWSGQLLSGRPVRVDRLDDETVARESQRFFDFDAVITLGALAVAGGALAVVAAATGRRGKLAERDEEPTGRGSVFEIMQADLVKFADSYRRAA